MGNENIDSVISSLNNIIAIKKYYQEVCDTYKGGCMTARQAEAGRKVKSLEMKIKETASNCC